MGFSLIVFIRIPLHPGASDFIFSAGEEYSESLEPGSAWPYFDCWREMDQEVFEGCQRNAKMMPALAQVLNERRGDTWLRLESAAASCRQNDFDIVSDSILNSPTGFGISLAEEVYGGNCSCCNTKYLKF